MLTCADVCRRMQVKHVVGGFSVVVRMPDQGIAYRMQVYLLTYADVC